MNGQRDLRSHEWRFECSIQRNLQVSMVRKEMQEKGDGGEDLASKRIEGLIVTSTIYWASHLFSVLSVPALAILHLFGASDVLLGRGQEKDDRSAP